MADVRLIIRADTSEAIKSIRKLIDENQKLSDTAQKQVKDQLSAIEKEIYELESLRKARIKAQTKDEVIEYNKAIEAQVKKLNELEGEEQKVVKQTETMTQSIGKWIAGLGLAATVLNKLKDAFLQTTQGINIFNIAGAAMNQVLSNIVNGVGQWNQGVAQAIALQKELNAIRIKSYAEEFKAKALMQEYNKLYTEGIDHTITSEQKIKKLTEAKKKYIEAVNIEIASTKELLINAKKQWELNPTNEKALVNMIALAGKLKDLQGQVDQGTRRLESAITAEQQQQIDKRKKIFEDYYAWLERVEEGRLKNEKERAEKNYKYWYDWYEGIKKLFEQALEEKKKSDENYWQFNLDIGRKLWEQNKDLAKVQWAEFAKIMGFDPDTGEPIEGKDISVWSLLGLDSDKDSDKIDAMKETASMIMDTLGQVIDRQVEMRERERELLDNRISETQQALETEVELYKAGYASNVAAKQKELDELKRQRDTALKEEEEALKKQRQMETVSQTINLMSSVANILKEFTKLGPWGLALSAVAIGSLYAMWAGAKSKTAELAKYAKGGWTGDGTQRDETGERVAGVVHEKEFVVRKGPAYRFREVLEAINKEDRGLIVNKFNKIVPELVPVNNIHVENNGPNNRLDRVNNKLAQISKQLEPKKETKEQVLNTDKGLVYHKGNITRTVR